AGGRPPALAVGAVAVVGGWLFVRHERASTSPLVAPEVIRAPRMVSSLLAALAGYALLFRALVPGPPYLHGRGPPSPVTVGLVLAAVPVAIGVMAPIAGHYSDRKPLLVTAAGLASAIVVLIAIAAIRPAGAALAALLGLVGLGLGAFTPANNRSI